MVFRRMAWRAAWGYLVLVLLLAPMLGLTHRLVHGLGAERQVVHAIHAHAAEVEGAVHEHGHEHHWLNDVFSAHGEDADCRIFDQLSHSDVLPALPLLVLPMVLSALVFLFLEGEVRARWAALYEARGPPLTR